MTTEACNRRGIFTKLTERVANFDGIHCHIDWLLHLPMAALATAASCRAWPTPRPDLRASDQSIRGSPARAKPLT